MEEKGRCPVCEAPSSAFRSTLGLGIDCQRCRVFEMSETVLLEIRDIKAANNKSPDDLRLLKYLCAGIRLAGETSRNTPKLEATTWREYASAVATAPVSRKKRRFLDLIEKRSQIIGSVVRLDAEQDYPLIGASGVGEFWEFFRFIRDQGHIQEDGSSHDVKLTIKGWEELEPSGGGIPGRCFVAMSFHSDLNDAWEAGIKPALERDCHLHAVRVDKEHHNEKICDVILAEVRRCEFLVADFSLHRQGVYFEAGFAMGLGKEVIWLCREDEFTDDKKHFDTRQYNHIVWKNPVDLRKQLGSRIRARRPLGR